LVAKFALGTTKAQDAAKAERKAKWVAKNKGVGQGDTLSSPEYWDNDMESEFDEPKATDTSTSDRHTAAPSMPGNDRPGPSTIDDVIRNLPRNSQGPQSTSCSERHDSVPAENGLH
jgi:hypothetical protein